MEIEEREDNTGETLKAKKFYKKNKQIHLKL
jgi:hypothetical protein